MGVRYTEGPIQYSTAIRSDTSAHMIADIDTVIGPCVSAKLAVTGGWKYTLQSPDGLRMKLWIQDLGDNDFFHGYIRITPTSYDETLTGVYGLVMYSGSTYEAWANQCQFFIAPLGSAPNNPNLSYAAGILALTENSTGPCTAGSAQPTVTELWWSSSGGAGLFGRDLRSARVASGLYSLCYSGVLYKATGTNDVLNLALVTLCSAINVDTPYGSPPPTIRYGTGDGLRIDALLAQERTLYGQLWDAHLLTIPATLDSIATLTDIDSSGQTVTSDWVAWNYGVTSNPNGGAGTVLGTLFLLTAAPFTKSFANVAY